jgi:hypothetical protein
LKIDGGVSPFFEIKTNPNLMKKLLILLAIFTTFATTAQSVGINADGSAANASAILDLKSTTQGFLPPRMTLAQRSAISFPVEGLVLWCSNCGNGELQVYNGIEWTNMLGGIALAGSPKISATTAATAISGGSATSGGNVTDDGGNIITARGLCWSTSHNPTTANSITTESGTTGSFTSSITGLTPNSTYYVRAYATNVAGTTYGSQVSFITSLLVVGEQFQGGIVAYILAPFDPGYNPNVQHGLIAASVDQGANIPLSNGYDGYCFSNTGGQTSTILGTGSANTSAIIQTRNSSGLAAGLAISYRGGNYTDWYLPSRDELNKMYINKSIIGGFIDINYWSSSESSCQMGWYQDFSNGTQSTTYMDLTMNVRAIRSF